MKWFLLLAVSAAACTRHPDPIVLPGNESLASIPASYARRGELHGTVMVVRGGMVAMRVAYGTGEEVSHAYHIAQITKLFTATLVMVAVERGIIEIDAPARVYVADGKEDEAKSVTVRDLLKQTDYHPLMKLAEEALQDTYGHLLKQFIFGPAAMKETSLDPELDDYRGEADMVSTADDLARFARAFAQKKIISEETRATMLNPKAPFGCFVHDNVIDRRGALEKAVTSLQIINDHDIVIVLDDAGDTSVDPLTDEMVSALTAY